jgi:hypothetical protein
MLCHYAESRILCIVMVNFIMLNVVMLSVVAPAKGPYFPVLTLPSQMITNIQDLFPLFGQIFLFSNKFLSFDEMT